VFDMRVLGGKLALQIIDNLTPGLSQDQSGIGSVRFGLGPVRSGPTPERSGPILGPQFANFSILGPAGLVRS